MTTLGAIFPPDLPPEQLREVAMAADRTGLEQLWLWEDCFKESGIATAAAVLGWTERVQVGIGLLPVPLRNVALTAMELATLERLFPGRTIPGLGHGVAEWMAQVGNLAASPMTLLREYTTALTALLTGAEVSVQGRYVKLDKVKLDWPPATPPPLLIGGIRPKTVTMAGELGDGVILTGDTELDDLPAAVDWVKAGRQQSHRSGRLDVVVFIAIPGRPTARQVADRLAGFIERGATHTILLSLGEDAPSLAEFVEFVAQEVRPLVS